MPAVEFRVEHSVRDGLGGVGREVVGVHGRGGPAPPPDRVLEVPDQLPLLGVDADPRVVGSHERPPLLRDVAELGVPVGVGLPGEPLAVPAEPVPVGPEQSADGGRAGPPVRGRGQPPRLVRTYRSPVTGFPAVSG